MSKVYRAEHTPGPWRADFVNRVKAKGILAAYEFRIGPEGRDGFLAQVQGFAPEQQANARLIASSPKLLNACKEVMQKLCNMDTLSGTQNNGRRLSAISTLARAIDEADGSVTEQNKAMDAMCPTVAVIEDNSLHAEANARLLAAAPDLLRACKNINDWYGLIRQDYPELLGPFKDARSAIAKAEGRE